MKRILFPIVLTLFASTLSTYAQTSGESVGAMGGAFGVSPMGGATYTIPIEVPTGINGMQPSLSIVYNSQAGNGLCGYGTNLAGFSSITRVPKDIYHDGAAGGVKYLADDALYLDGVRLIHMSGTEGQDGVTYSPESDPFTTVIAHGTCSSSQNNIWYEVQSSDGMIYWYDTQLTYSKDGSQRIHSWYLSRAIQPDGNYIGYMYDEVDNYMYPTYIVYGKNTNSQQNALSDTIKFFYETRNDSIPVRFDGKKGTINKRLKTIMCKTNDEVFRTYTLNYNDTGDGTATKYSRLTDITEKNGQNESLPATRMNWSYLPTANNITCSNLTVNFPSNLGNGVSFPFADQNLFSGDFNNDGLTDIVGLGKVSVPNSDDGFDYYTYVYIYYASRSSTGDIQYTYGQKFELPPTINMTFMEASIRSMSVIDIDGDGLNELIMPYFTRPGNVNGSVYIYVIGQDFPAFMYYGVGLYGSSKPLFTTGDINNDGRSDVILMETDKHNGKYPVSILPYNPNYIYGNLEMAHCLFDTNISTSLSLSSSPKQAYLTDMNGNGLQDLFVICSDCYTIFWNQGGSICSNTFSDSNKTIGTDPHDVRSLTAGDFNGDGLLDLLSNAKESKYWYFYLNNGDGTFSRTSGKYLSILSDQQTENDDNRVFVNVVDFDCDGKSDVIVTKGVYKWDGNSLGTRGVYDYTITKWLNSTGTSLVEKHSAISEASETMNPMSYITGDFNGDGYIELANYGNNCVNGSYHTYNPDWHIYINSNLTSQTGKTTSIYGDFGSTTSIIYSTLTNTDVYTPGGSGSYPICHFTIPLNVVKTVTQDNGAADSQTSSYLYSGLKAHLQGKGLLGFNSTEVTNSTLGTTVRTEITGWNDTYYVPSSTRAITTIGALSSQTENTITVAGKGRKRFFSYPSQVIATDMDGNTVTTYTECDTTSGNVTMERTYYGNSAGMYTQTEYQNYTTNLPGRSNKPQRVVVTRQYHNDTPFVTITEYSYDAKGHVIQRCDNAQSSSLHLTTSYTYDLWGNLTSETACGSGVAELTTYYSYDATHRFPVRIYTNPSSTVQNFSYDLWGNILTEQDSINPGIENLITHTYDGWGSRVRTQMPGSGEVTYTKGWGSSNAQRFYTMEQGTARPWVRTWYDSRGREVMTESIGADDMPVSSVMTYDGKGQRISETETTGNLTLTHNYEYDDRGRLMRETHPGGNVIEYTYSLDGHSKIVSDNGRQTTYNYDVVGNLLEVHSPLSSSLAHTYSSAGGIKQTVTDGATWTVTYDECGNRISMTDPDAGTTTYAYDALGRERERIDGRGVVFLTNYDYLGRVTSMTAGNETTTYTYGTGGNGQMRLTSESNGCWTKSYTYDRYGRVNNETMTKIGDSYSRSMTYRYNASGLLSGKDYPGSKSVSYSYDAYGNCTTVNFEENKLLWHLTGNTGKAATSTVALFNSSTPYVRTTQLDNVGNLQSRIMTHGGTTLQNDSYVFDPQTGNLLSRTLTGHPTETFTYDALDRLTRATCPGQMAMDMNYLDNGNISTKTNMGLYSYDNNNRPHAVDYIEACSEVQDDYQYIDYNAWNKAEEIYNSLGGDGYTYEIEYGPDGQRVMSRMYKNGSLYCRKFYWGEYEEIHFYSNSETVRTYWVEAPDGLAGMFWTSTSDYYTVVHPNVAMTDHLGSLTGLYDYDGNKVFDASYDAWGKRTLSPNSFTFIARGYTGHEHLDELALINMNGRMYDPRQGRFLSPDPFVQAPSNPQNYNRYSYCLNNPLKYTDPSGESIIGAVALGALMGTYMGGVLSNEGEKNPLKWDYESLDTWCYMACGLYVGALSGAAGGLIASSGIPMANTLSIMGGSLTNSLGTFAYTGGKTDITMSFGFASYNFTKNEWGCLGKKGNTILENIGYGFGALANLPDLISLFSKGGETIMVNSESTKRDANGQKDWWGHESITRENGESLVSVGPIEPMEKSDYLYETYINSIKDADTNWPTYYGEEGTWSITLNNVSTKAIAGYAENIKRWDVLFNSCVGHATRSLWRAGIPALYAFHPHMLNVQLLVRQIGIYSSPYLYQIPK